VELKHLVIGQPTLLVEVVYILSNDAVKLAQLIQLGKGEVGLVRLGIGGQPTFLKYLPPFFLASGLLISL